MSIKLEKICKKHKLDKKLAKEIIIAQHELNNFYKPKELKSLEINLDIELLKLISKYCKYLKVEESAVVSACLKEYIDNYEDKT